MLSFLSEESPSGIFLAFVLLSLLTVGMWGFYYILAHKISTLCEGFFKKDACPPIPWIKVMTLVLCGVAILIAAVTFYSFLYYILCLCSERPAFDSFKGENIAEFAGFMLFSGSLFGVNYYFYRKYYPGEKTAGNSDKPRGQEMSK